MSIRRKIVAFLDPALAARERLHRQRAFLFRDTLKQIAWRQVMDLRSPDQKAAHRLIHMRLEHDDALERGEA